MFPLWTMENLLKEVIEAPSTHWLELVLSFDVENSKDSQFDVENSKDLFLNLKLKRRRRLLTKGKSFVKNQTKPKQSDSNKTKENKIKVFTTKRKDKTTLIKRMYMVDLSVTDPFFYKRLKGTHETLGS